MAMVMKRLGQCCCCCCCCCWRQLLLLLVVLAVSLLSTEASSGGGWRGEIRSVRMRAEVTLRYAATQVTVALRNPDTTRSSGYVQLALQLPGQAFVSALTIEVNGHNTTTEVRDKRRESGVRAPPGTARPRGNRLPSESQKFRARARVGGGETAVFYVTYEQLLQRYHGAYTCHIYLPPYTNGGAEVEDDGGGGGVEAVVEIREVESITNLNVELSGQAELYTQGRTNVSPSEVHLTFHNNNNNTNNNNSNDKNKNSSSNNNNNNNNNLLSISYDVERKADGGEIQVLGNFFVHYLSPEGLTKLPTHTVFALDVSGSMSDHGKLDTLKETLVEILEQLTEEDTFELLVFSTRVRSLGVYRGVPGEVAEGAAKIRRVQALGGTNFNEALLQAITGAAERNVSQNTARQVVFLTDGKPNLGETRPEELRRNVRQANHLHLPLFSLALGGEADVKFLRQVSADNGGYMKQLDERRGAGSELRRFYREISEPLLTEVDVAYQEEEVEANSVIRQGPPIFYSGSEMVLSGRLRGGAVGVNPVVAGRGRDGPLQLNVSRTHHPTEDRTQAHQNSNNSPLAIHQRGRNYVERLWAYLTVQDLLDSQEIVEDRNLRAEMRARAKEIAIRFQFVTKLTSLGVSGGQVVGVSPPFDHHHHHHLGLKSGPRHHKSHIIQGDLQDLELLSASEFAKTLPAPLSSRIQNARPFSFSDNDPHFVVQAPGMNLPFCFDLHSSHGSTLSLIRDHNSGVVVNGLVTAAMGRTGATYFTKMFISLGGVNFTITINKLHVDCVDDHGLATVSSVASSLWPLSSGRRRGRRRRQGRRRSRGGRGKNAGRRESVVRGQGNGSSGGRDGLEEERMEVQGGTGVQRGIETQRGTGVRRGPGERLETGTQQRMGAREDEGGGAGGSIIGKGSRGAGRSREDRRRERGERRRNGNRGDRREGDERGRRKNKGGRRRNKKRNKEDRVDGRERRDEDDGIRNYDGSKNQESRRSRRTHQALHPRISPQPQSENLRIRRSLASNHLPYTHVPPSWSITSPRDSRTGGRNQAKSRHYPQTPSYSWPHHFPVRVFYAKNSPVQSSPALDNSKSVSNQYHYRPNRESMVKAIHYADSEVRTVGRALERTDAINEMLAPNSNLIRRRRYANNQIHPHSFSRWINLHQGSQASSSATERFDPHRSTNFHPQSLSGIHPLSPRKPVLRRNEIDRTRYDQPDLQTDNSLRWNEINRTSLVTSKPSTFDNLRQNGIERANVDQLQPQVVNNRQYSFTTHTTRDSSQNVFHPQERDFLQRKLGVGVSQQARRHRDRQAAESAHSPSQDQTIRVNSQTPQRSHPDITASEPTRAIDTSSRFSRTHHDQPTVVESSWRFNRSRSGSPQYAATPARSVVAERDTGVSAEDEDGEREQLIRECRKTLSWKKSAGRRYGRVVVSQRNRRTLEFTLGDAEVSLVVTRSKNHYGQHFLGVYLQRHSALSPNTTGIIGQFVYKTVGTIGQHRGSATKQDDRVRVAVLHPGPERRYQVSQVNAVVSSRRSLLTKTHVTCLFVRNEGRGLVAGTPSQYELPCLAC